MILFVFSSSLDEKVGEAWLPLWWGDTHHVQYDQRALGMCFLPLWMCVSFHSWHVEAAQLMVMICGIQ
jgi:hypothetical protein